MKFKVFDCCVANLVSGAPHALGRAIAARRRTQGSSQIKRPCGGLPSNLWVHHYVHLASNPLRIPALTPKQKGRETPPPSLATGSSSHGH